MHKSFNTIRNIAIIACITGFAAWGVQQVRFFDKLPIIFSQSAFAETLPHGEGMNRGSGGFRGGRGRDMLALADSDKPAFPEQGRGGQGVGNGMGRGHGGHAYTASLEGWINVGAYLAIFAFGVMLTYYVERGIRTLTKRRETCVDASGFHQP